MKRYDAEAHLYHRNEKYPTWEEAIEHEDGCSYRVFSSSTSKCDGLIAIKLCLTQFSGQKNLYRVLPKLYEVKFSTEW